MESWCEELLLALFQHLSVGDRGILAQVCCKFRRLLSDATLWRDVVVTFSQGQVLLSVGKSTSSRVADIGQYAKRYGSMARSLQLKVRRSIPTSDSQLLEFMVKMEEAKLESLSLSLQGPLTHLSSFLKSQSALRRARVASVCPRTSLQCLTDICQSSASHLQELCWQYKPLRLSPSRCSGLPKTLQQLGRFSRDGTFLLRALQVFCQTAGSCPKLRLFQTNVFCNAIWSHLVNSTYRTSAHLLTVALTVDESSTLSEPTTATLTAEECQKFRVVLYVNSVLSVDVDGLMNLPNQLPISNIYIKLSNVLEMPSALVIMHRMAEKFQSSLAKAEFLIKEYRWTSHTKQREDLQTRSSFTTLQHYLQGLALSHNKGP